MHPFAHMNAMNQKRKLGEAGGPPPQGPPRMGPPQMGGGADVWQGPPLDTFRDQGGPPPQMGGGMSQIASKAPPMPAAAQGAMRDAYGPGGANRRRPRFWDAMAAEGGRRGGLPGMAAGMFAPEARDSMGSDAMGRMAAGFRQRGGGGSRGGMAANFARMFLG